MLLRVQRSEDQVSAASQLIVDSQGEVYAHILDASIEDGPEQLIELVKEQVKESPGVQRIVVHCAKRSHEMSEDMDASRLLASWSPAGWTKFDEQVEQFDEFAGQLGVELLIRPNAQGTLSDAICTNSWARRAESLSCSLLLDPIGWLVPSMMRDVGDHLDRIAELCLECPKAGAILIRSVKQEANGDLVEVPISQGDIDPGLIVERFLPVVESGVNGVVLDEPDLVLLSG